MIYDFLEVDIWKVISWLVMLKATLTWRVSRWTKRYIILKGVPMVTAYCEKACRLSYCHHLELVELKDVSCIHS